MIIRATTQHLRLIQHGYTQLLRLDQLVACFSSSNHIIGLFFRDATSHLYARGFESRLGFAR